MFSLIIAIAWIALIARNGNVRNFCISYSNSCAFYRPELNLWNCVLYSNWYHRFLEFWLVNTWFFAHWRHQRASTHLENKCQSNTGRGKKLNFLISHKQPPCVWWSVKLVLQTKLQKSNFCVRPWSLLTIINFSKRGPTDTTVF